MPIRHVAGDIFDNEHGVQSFAHGCNCLGSMGAGVAKILGSRYPEMYEEYRGRCSEGDASQGDGDGRRKNMLGRIPIRVCDELPGTAPGS